MTEYRVTHAALFDAEIRPHNELFRAAANVRPTDRVLDIGCGTGQSTREAASAAVNGSVLGVDVSPASLDLARQLSDGLDNVSYLMADAETHSFPAAHFDLCISRFGTMFFANPVAAFTNIGRALRQEARLVLLVWQEHDRNEWAYAVREAIAPNTPGPADGPFSLSNTTTVDEILSAAGFTDITFTDVHKPVYYGPDVTTAYNLVLALHATKDMLATLSGPAHTQALEQLHTTITTHYTDRGVLFDSHAWILTARHTGPA